MAMSATRSEFIYGSTAPSRRRCLQQQPHFGDTMRGYRQTTKANVEIKTARLTILVDPQKKKAFEKLCATQDLTPSQVIRQFLRDYLAEHGVQWQGTPTRKSSKRR